MTVDFHSKITYNVPDEGWEKKLLEHNTSTVYQTHNWQEVFKQVYDSIPVYITVFNSNNDIVGQLAALIHKKHYWKDVDAFTSFIGQKLNLRTYLNWFHGPVIHDYSNQNAIVAEILSNIDRIVLKNKVTFIRGISPPLDQNISNKSFKKFGYKLESWATYITELHQTSDELFQSLNKKTRYDIKKSESNELEFEVVNNINSYHEFSNVKWESLERSGQKPKRRSIFFEKHFELLYKPGYEKLFLVRHNGKILSGILTEIFNGHVIQHGVGNSLQTKLRPGSFLTWHTIKWALENNFSTFDMGGINPMPKSKKEEQIDFYKSKWAGKKYNYFLYTKIINKTKSKIASFLQNPNKISQISKRIRTSEF